MVSIETWQHISSAVKYLKYLLALGTTALTVVSLLHETSYKNDDHAAIKKRLTPVGTKYLKAVLCLALATLFTSWLGDRADDNLAAAAKEDFRIDSTRQWKGISTNNTRDRLALFSRV